MAYESGLLKHRIIVQNRTKGKDSKFGIDGDGIEWEDTCKLWASVDFARGTRAMNAGALDAYAVVTVRLRWTDQITMRSRIVHDGVTYQIIPETFHAEKQENTIQFQAQAII